MAACRSELGNYEMWGSLAHAKLSAANVAETPEPSKRAETPGPKRAQKDTRSCCSAEKDSFAAWTLATGSSTLLNLKLQEINGSCRAPL
jgi:hypothetical protein